MMPPNAQHFHVIFADDVAGWSCLGLRATGQFAEIQQRQRHHAEQRDHRLQAILELKLRVLDTTAGLHGLVIFFNDPAALVPAPDVECVGWRLDRMAFYT